MINKIHNCNNMDLLKTMPDNSVCTILSDIPYGLQDIDALKLIKENANNTRGFMGKIWDVLPTTEMLTEFNRVLKDGGFFVTTFTARQDLQCVLQYRLLEAGFDISFSSIIWNYQTGFPKSANFSKISQKRSGVEMEFVGSKMGMPGYSLTDGKNSDINVTGRDGNKECEITKPTTDEAKYMEGLYSCQLKPAYEPIIIAQKRYKEKSKIDHITTWYNERKALLDSGIAEEDLSLYTKNASGGINRDLARIPTNETLKCDRGGSGMYNNIDGKWYRKDNGQEAKNHNPAGEQWENTEGRVAATILVSNNAMDVFRITKSSDAVRHNNNKINPIFIGNNSTTFGHSDQGDLSRYFSLDAWVKKNQPELYKLSQKALELQHDTEIIYPFLNTSKPSQAEGNAGLDGYTLKNNISEDIIKEIKKYVDK